MSFREEFNKEMKRISPTEEQISRIAKNVHKKLDAPAKKPSLYMRIAAVSGGVLTAAVLVFAMVFVFPKEVHQSANHENTNNGADLFDNAGGAGNAMASGQPTQHAPETDQADRSSPGILANESDKVSDAILDGAKNPTSNMDHAAPEIVAEFADDLCILYVEGEKRVYRQTDEVLAPDGEALTVKVMGGGEAVVQYDENLLAVNYVGSEIFSYYRREE